jgi:tetratricopeptide (TPR) repeat protein
MVLYQNYQWKEALVCIDSLRQEGVSLDILPIEAECYAGIGEYATAIDMVEKEIASSSQDKHHYLYHTLGNIYHFQKKYDKAIANYQKAIDIRPTYARPYIHLGETYQLLGDNERSIEYLLSAIDLFSQNDFHNEVIEYSNKVLSLDLSNIDALMYLQYSLHATEQYERGLSAGMEIYRIATEDNITDIHPQNWVLTGMNAFHCMEYELSYNMLTMALKEEALSGEDAWLAVCYLSAVSYMQGNKEAAKEFEEIAKESGPAAKSFIKELRKQVK